MRNPRSAKVSEITGLARRPDATTKAAQERPWGTEQDVGSGETYSTGGGVVVGRLASHLEGDIVGGVALELKGRGRAVVEVLVDKLEIE